MPCPVPVLPKAYIVPGTERAYQPTQCLVPWPSVPAYAMPGTDSRIILRPSSSSSRPLSTPSSAPGTARYLPTPALRAARYSLRPTPASPYTLSPPTSSFLPTPYTPVSLYCPPTPLPALPFRSLYRPDRPYPL
eukprot:1089699-Rhodomonas_salina.1